MMAQLVEQRIRNAWVAICSSLVCCRKSLMRLRDFPKPVRRVRLPYLAPSTKETRDLPGVKIYLEIT